MTGVRFILVVYACCALFVGWTVVQTQQTKTDSGVLDLVIDQALHCAETNTCATTTTTIPSPPTTWAEMTIDNLDG